MRARKLVLMGTWKLKRNVLASKIPEVGLMTDYTSRLDWIGTKGRPSARVIQPFATREKLGTKEGPRFFARRNLRNSRVLQLRNLSGPGFRPSNLLVKLTE